MRACSKQTKRKLSELHQSIVAAMSICEEDKAPAADIRAIGKWAETGQFFLDNAIRGAREGKESK